MKILALEYCREVTSVDEAIVSYPDSTLIRNNDDFYVPNFAHKVVAFAGIYLHFSKIGKCVEPKFTNRYYNEAGAAVKFIANYEKGVSLPDMFRSFDASLAVSNDRILLTDGDIQKSCDLLVKVNGKVICTEQNIIDKIPDLVSTATKYFTIKIGDLFFVPFVQIPLQVSFGDTMDLSLGEDQLLTCTIK